MILVCLHISLSFFLNFLQTVTTNSTVYLSNPRHNKNIAYYFHHSHDEVLQNSVGCRLAIIFLLDK